MNTAKSFEPQKDPLLQVDNLAVEFRTEYGTIMGVREVSFQIKRGETVAIVGESGCGKSVSSLAIMGLLPPVISRIKNGSIKWCGPSGRVKEITGLKQKAMRSIRGNEIAMIFQEPMTSLNPVYTVGDQISEAILLHQSMSKAKATELARQMLADVGIPEPAKRLAAYPHELSGGMRQRVMIAMALTCRPSLLIADEPTTALDVTIQAQILDLMRRLQSEQNMSMLFISHDLGVVAEVADRVIVMYAGQVVESADVVSVLKSPRHPYTKGLLSSLPRLLKEGDEKQPLSTISGNVPDPSLPVPPCAFGPRCDSKQPRCIDEPGPKLIECSAGHMVRCHQCETI
jgi:oligopeptide/dipeptide ABC transporter ATP-binding protein